MRGMMGVKRRHMYMVLRYVRVSAGWCLVSLLSFSGSTCVIWEELVGKNRCVNAGRANDMHQRCRRLEEERKSDEVHELRAWGKTAGLISDDMRPRSA
jgi:hypothetical protein